MGQSDVEVLIPKPELYKVAGEELRQAPLPVRRVLEVIRFVEANYDLVDKVQLIGKPAEAGGKSLSGMLEEEVYTRLNKLLRLLLPGHENVLTDEWCLNHLSNAHYWAIIKTALVQNQMYEVFSRAKGILGAHLEAALRQTTPPPSA